MYGVNHVSQGHPPISLPIVVAIVLALGFLYACGAPGSRDHRAVYLTFLTGTPAALGGAILWLSWFKNDSLRNAAMVSVAALGYVLYCVLVVFADWARSKSEDEKGLLPPLHYFVPMGVALVIAVVLGASHSPS